MKRSLYRCRLIGWTLMILGVMGLVSSGTGLAASVNVTMTNEGLTTGQTQAQLSAKPNLTPCHQRGVILDDHQSHCSAKILTLSGTPQSVLAPVRQDNPTPTISDLKARTFTPDPPPPRAA